MQIRLRLAEKGMCFVTRRISKMAWEPELQRKEVAVQAWKTAHKQRNKNACYGPILVSVLLENVWQPVRRRAGETTE